MSKRKFLIIAFVIIVLVLSTFTFFRFRNGTRVSALGREDITYTVSSYRQDDESWGEDTLGNSTYTMKSSGCLTTCIATSLSYNSDEINPGELNNLFSQNGVYDSEGNLMWQQIEKVFHSADVLSTVSEAAIYNYLNKGHFPIVRVRVNGFGNFHYVLIVGIENGEYICMDPLKDDLTPLSDYFNKVYAIRVVY